MSIKYNVIIQKEEEWYVAKCIDNSVAKYKNYQSNKICIVPMQYDIARGTLKSILEQANIELEDFLNQL